MGEYVGEIYLCLLSLPLENMFSCCDLSLFALSLSLSVVARFRSSEVCLPEREAHTHGKDKIEMVRGERVCAGVSEEASMCLRACVCS